MNIKFERADLISRSLGARYRRQVLSALENDRQVVFDFSQVTFVSDLFADELFGILAKKLGLITFKKQVKILGISSSSAHTLAVNIDNRIKSQVVAA